MSQPTPTDLRSETLRALREGASSMALVALLRRHRDHGLSAAEAQAALEGLRAGLSEADEDRVLEMLDVVTGFCRAELRVWGRG